MHEFSMPQWGEFIKEILLGRKFYFEAKLIREMSSIDFSFETSFHAVGNEGGFYEMQ